MSDKHDHHRDNEHQDYPHIRDEDYVMPNSVKWIANFVNRVGFPVFAFCVMVWFCFITIERNTKAIGDLRDVMISVKAVLDRK